MMATTGIDTSCSTRSRHAALLISPAPPLRCRADPVSKITPDMLVWARWLVAWLLPFAGAGGAVQDRHILMYPPRPMIGLTISQQKNCPKPIITRKEQPIFKAITRP